MGQRGELAPLRHLFVKWRMALDYYEILGVSPNASDAMIRVAYRQRLKEVHPDTGEPESLELADVLEAGAALLKPADREVYDQERNARNARSSAEPDLSPDPAGRELDQSSLRWVAVVAALAALVVLLVVLVRGSGDEVLASSVGAPPATATPAPAAEVDPPDTTGGTEEAADEQDEAPAEPAAVAAPTDVPDAVDEEPQEAPAEEPVEGDATEVEEAADELVEAPAEVAAPTDVPDAGDEEADEQPEEELAEEPAEATPAVAAVSASDPADEEEPTAVESSEEEEAEKATESADKVEETADLPDLADLPERGAIYRAPTLYLVGPVPSQKIADQFIAKAEAVVGAENVVNEYVVHPDAPLDLNGHVRVEQAVVFETNSAVIREPFFPVLGLALQVLGQNPQASLVVEGHTDSVGTDENNLQLSQLRANAVRDWLIAQGVDPGKVQAIGFGESQPVAENETEQGRTLNRRIEFQILDLLN